MKTFILILASLTAHLSQASSLHCDVYESAKSPFPVSFDRPLSTTAGDSAIYELGSLNGTKIMVSTVSFGNQALPLTADARIYVEVRGLRIDGNKSILLVSPSKDLFEAHCKIEE